MRVDNRYFTLTLKKEMDWNKYLFHQTSEICLYTKLSDNTYQSINAE